MIDFRTRLNSLEKALEEIKTPYYIEKFDKLHRAIIDAAVKDKAVYIIGNGGSAADAQHIAAEYVGKLGSRITDKENAEKRYKYSDKVNSLKIFALVDSPNISALGNDFGYDKIFENQLANFLRKGDLVIALTTSGKSKNVVKGVNYALGKENTVWVIGGQGLEKNLNLYNQGDNFNYIALPLKETEGVQELYKHIFHTSYKEI